MAARQWSVEEKTGGSERNRAFDFGGGWMRIDGWNSTGQLPSKAAVKAPSSVPLVFSSPSRVRTRLGDGGLEVRRSEKEVPLVAVGLPANKGKIVQGYKEGELVHRVKRGRRGVDSAGIGKPETGAWTVVWLFSVPRVSLPTPCRDRCNTDRDVLCVVRCTAKAS